jgi:urocanate hydratase
VKFTRSEECTNEDILKIDYSINVVRHRQVRFTRSEECADEDILKIDFINVARSINK